MKKILLSITCVGLISLLAGGCSNFNQENIKEKAIAGNGYVAINKISTVIDPTTGEFAPNLKSYIIKGQFYSIPLGASLKDFLQYSSESSASVFNASAKTSTESLTFSTSNKELMTAVLNALAKKLEENCEADSDTSIPD